VQGAVDVSPVARCQSSREMRNGTWRRRGPSTARWSKSSQGSCVIPSRVITFRDREMSIKTRLGEADEPDE
jgi:hypothetical protein